MTGDAAITFPVISCSMAQFDEAVTIIRKINRYLDREPGLAKMN
jgi:hypothetical protein